MPKLREFSAPVLSNKLSKALGQRSHVQQVYLMGVFPSRTAYLRAIKNDLLHVLDAVPSPDRVSDRDLTPDHENDEPGSFFVEPKDSVTVGPGQIPLPALIARLP